MVTIDGHQTNISTSMGLLIFAVLTFVYILPTIYNFWMLFAKAKKPGWAVIIPIYGPVVAAQIARVPIYIGVLFGIIGIFQYSSNNSSVYLIQAMQTIIEIALGILILKGLSRQYKANSGFWILLVILPLLASPQVASVKYKTQKLAAK